jgi:hypothetical protein
MEECQDPTSDAPAYDLEQVLSHEIFLYLLHLPPRAMPRSRRPELGWVRCESRLLGFVAGPFIRTCWLLLMSRSSRDSATAGLGNSGLWLTGVLLLKGRISDRSARSVPRQCPVSTAEFMTHIASAGPPAGTKSLSAVLSASGNAQ